MNDAKFDVTAIGNAIVDVLAKADDALLVQHNLPKGGMSLIDAETAERLYAIMGPGVEKSGGSAGNTADVGACLTLEIGVDHDQPIRRVGGQQRQQN